jgi:hypothetical protein
MPKRGHHLAGDRGHLLDITTRTGGDFGAAEHHILRGPTAQGAHDAGTELGLAHQHLVLIRGEPGQALGLAAGDQG